MSFFGNLPIFEHKSCEWPIFKCRLTQFFKVNDVKEDKKGAILITHLSDESYRLVRNLAYPEELEALSFKKLVELLDSHFKPRQCSFADKAKFHGATRYPDETLADWAARVRGLASRCDFGTALEINLTDRFVLGLGPGPGKDKLFERSPSDLSLMQALELAEQAECARDAKSMASMGSSSSIKEEAVYKLSYSGRGKRSGGDRSGRSDYRVRSDFRCDVCGLKNHDKESCRYKNYKCEKCGKKGHLKKVCDQRNKSGGIRVNNLECNASSASETEVECVECHNFKLRYVTDKPLQLDVILGNKSLVMELDSGSGVSVISKQLYSEMFTRYKLNNCKLKMCLYDGHRISPLGFFFVNAKYNNRIKEIKIFVVDSNGPPLLGRDFMSAFELVLTTNVHKIFSHDSDVSTLLEQYPNLWSDELGTFNQFEVHLKLKENTTPKFFKARTVPFALKDKVEKELDRLERLGILVPINKSRYATPIVPVLKENGSVKIAGDYSVTLNKDLVIDRYPLPRIEEVFAKLGGGEHYTKIDLKNAYNQFRLSDDSQELTTINTPKGLYKYTRLVYGLANAPAIFQKSMEILLSGIEGVSIWLDDICLTGPTKALHLERLGKVLSRLNSAGLRLQKDKCSFFQENVTYLGFIIDKNGLRTSPDKVKAILLAPEPTNVTEVKRFLGIVNYYRNFIPNASSIMSPLHELLRAGAQWKWGDRQRRAVQRVRSELSSERVLAHFEPTAQLVLAVDAGPQGLGAVLAQRDGDGRERPLAFGSRSLTASERNYSQIQKEATAIIFGIKHFHQYLYGRNEPFILKTDHRPLVSIFNNKTGIPMTTALRLQRYAIILSAYNYIVQYTPSENNIVADFFSRAPVPSTACDSDGEYDTYCSLNFLDAALPAVAISDVKNATDNDITLQTVVKYMNTGWPRKITCKNIRPYFLCKTDLQIEEGIILRGHKVVIPMALRERMLHELHKTHLGIVKMKSNARSRFWWPGIDEEIERWCASCEACASVRPSPPRARPSSWPRPAAPFQRVHIDYLSVGQRMYLVLIDAYSKWVECVYMQSGVSTQALIRKLKHIFSVFGIPNTLVSDNDVKINSKEFKEFCSSNGIEYMTSPIYHPCSNGQAENSVRTCKKMLKLILKGNLSQNIVEEKLLGYLFEYRNTVHCATGRSPAMLMFGRNLRSRLDLLIPKGRKQRHGEVTHNTIKTRILRVGDKVSVRWYCDRKEYWKLGVIEQIIGKRMYKVRICDQNVTCVRHIDQLILYKGVESKFPSISIAQPSARSPSPVPPSSLVTNQHSSSSTLGVEEEGSGDVALDGNVADVPVDAHLDCNSSEDAESVVVANPSQVLEEETISEAHQGSEFAQSSEPEQPVMQTRSRRPRTKVDYSKFF